jgi:hypothetical protein
MDVGNGKLSIRRRFRSLLQNTIDGKFTAPDGVANDPAIPQNAVSGTAFDLGAGALFTRVKSFISDVSSTHLMES